MYLDIAYILLRVYVGATVLSKAWHYCSLACAITYPAVPLAYESVGGIRAQGQGPVRMLSSQSIQGAGCGGGKQLSIARYLNQQKK